MSRNKADDFLRAMNPEPVEDQPAPKPSKPAPAAKQPKAFPTVVKETVKPATRIGLKHFGGYVDDDTLEKIALLRVRLKKDNSELIAFAIEELHRAHKAKRAFGDA